MEKGGGRGEVGGNSALVVGGIEAPDNIGKQLLPTLSSISIVKRKVKA